MPNYQNGKIYKIYSYENDDVYYGSTVKALSLRMAHHKSQMKKYKEGKKNYISSFKILELTSAKIELVENYPCNSKEELLQREGFYIRSNDCINKVIPCRTIKEYYEDNKDKKKIYYQENIEHIQEQKKNYYKQNGDEIKKKRREKYALQKEQQLMLKEDINITNI